MDKLDLFDKYIQGELSEIECSDFRSRLHNDDAFASEFNVYLLTISGICKEEAQDNLDFGNAMKQLSKEQLYEIIGRKPHIISREEIASRLRGRITYNNTNEYSGAAALDNSDDDEYIPSQDKQVDSLDDSQNVIFTEKENTHKNSMKTITLIFIVIILIFILIGIFI